jgi:hypothetical protein
VLDGEGEASDNSIFIEGQGSVSGNQVFVEEGDRQPGEAAVVCKVEP